MVKSDHDAIGAILRWMQAWMHNSYLKAGHLRFEAADAESDVVRDQKMAMARSIEELLDEPHEIYQFLVERYPDLKPSPITPPLRRGPSLAVDNTKKTPGRTGH